MKKKGIILIFCLAAAFAGKAQMNVKDTTVASGIITVEKDPRLDILAKKEMEFNVAAALGPRAAKGYRLLVLSSNDRALAMKTRSQLLIRYPEQKVYMTFQAPYIKLKFGDFVDKTDAEKFKDRIIKDRVVSTNVYVVPEIVEVKPDKNKDEDQ